MRDDQLKLELFRVKARLHLIERLCLKAYIVGAALSTEVTFAQARKDTLEALEEAASDGETGLLRKYGDISGALPADEFREIVEELKEFVRSLPGGD
jgi:hypothetical protein